MPRLAFGLEKRPTHRQIWEMRCFRCGAKPSYATWSICANDNRHVPICHECDVALNRAALRFMRVSKARLEALMRRYRRRTAA